MLLSPRPPVRQGGDRGVEMGVSLPPGKLSSDNTPAGQDLVKQSLFRAGLATKNRKLRHI